MDKSYIKDLYNRYAFEYHQKRRSSERSFYNEFIEVPAISGLVKDLVKGKRVLDIGCGTGIFTRMIVNWGGNVTGLDISEEMIKIAREENPGFEFHVLDAEKTKFSDKEFDIITSSLMIHYIDDLSVLFMEVNRILKSKGHFIFSFHHPFQAVIEKTKIDGQTKNIVNDYFGLHEYKWKMLNIEFISFHHTFECISDTLNDCGFLIEKIIEPQPVDKGQNIDIEEYNYTKRTPTFCVIKAIKINLG
jgi:ubiquinone/menaquinone biosynthesis C-methylase UbiE